MSNKEKVLVTGASGFVGSAVAHRLVESGYSVRALVRGTSPRAHLAGLDLEFVEGDIRDRKSVGARWLASATHFTWRPTIACGRAIRTRFLPQMSKVPATSWKRRYVRASSASSIRAVWRPLPCDPMGWQRTRPHRCAKSQGIGAYKRSKIAAERMVEAMVAERGLAAVIVNPSTPIGPRDVRPTPTGRIVVEAAQGRIPAFINTGLNLVHVDDVASGHLAALHHGTDWRTVHSRRAEMSCSRRC